MTSRTTFRTHAVRAREDGDLAIPADVAEAVLGRKEVRFGWESSLASITLSGPGGSVMLDGESDTPMAILPG